LLLRRYFPKVVDNIGLRENDFSIGLSVTSDIVLSMAHRSVGKVLNLTWSTPDRSVRFMRTVKRLSV